MEIIIPAAGLSTRFPNMRPKYTLTDYKGQMMFERALQYYIGKYNVTIGILREHENKYNISKYITDTYDKLINVVILEQKTNGPADTVYQILKQSNLSDDKEFFIKDKLHLFSLIFFIFITPSFSRSFYIINMKFIILFII